MIQLIVLKGARNVNTVYRNDTIHPSQIEILWLSTFCEVGTVTANLSHALPLKIRYNSASEISQRESSVRCDTIPETC